MEENEFDSLAGLARRLDTHRSSVSRAMHALQKSGYVSKVDGQWILTPSGKVEAARLRLFLPKSIAKAVEGTNFLIEQGRRAGLITDAMTNLPIRILDAAKLTLSETAQEVFEPLISSERVGDSLTWTSRDIEPYFLKVEVKADLFSSSERTMQSLKNVVEQYDSWITSHGTVQPLMSAAASVDLIASAHDAVQSMAKFALKADEWASIQETIQPPLVSETETLDLYASAGASLQPLLNAANRFDALMLAEKTVKPFISLDIADETPKLAQDAIQPLLSYATRFDSITLGLQQEANQHFTGATWNNDLLTPSKEHLGISAGLSADLITGKSGLEILGSSQLTSALDSIKTIALEPSLAEIAVGRAIQSVKDDSQPIVVDLYSHLIKEAVSSFSQSKRLGLASIEQVSVLGDKASPIINEFKVANLGLTGIISDLGTITMQDWTEKKGMVTLISNVAEVSRTYKGYFADVVGGLGKSSLVADRMDALISVPTWITSAYVGSVKAAIVTASSDLEDVYDQEVYSFPWRDSRDELDYVFRALGPNFSAMWQGAWSVLDSRSPDRIRQAAHSGRELLMQALATLAPDSEFTIEEIEKYGHKGKDVTRKMRVKRILGTSSDSTVNWVVSVAKALDETYYRLTGVSHDRSTNPHTTEQEVAGLLYTLGGLLYYIDARRNRTDG